jgi:lipid-binding SYLF domain-containing protein
MLLGLAPAPLPRVTHEGKTLESAAEVVHGFAATPLRGIPRGLLHDAAGVAVVPHVVKAGVILTERFGHGVVLVHEPDGRWGNPVFVSLSGKAIGVQAGVEKTDLVLVFKTRKGLDRALRGKLTLGGDVTVAAGPVGREAEAASDRRLPIADIYTWSRSRGLFLGVALDGARLQVDGHANDAFYGLRGCRPEQVLAHHPHHPYPGVERLKEELGRISR